MCVQSYLLKNWPLRKYYTRIIELKFFTLQLYKGDHRGLKKIVEK